MDRVYRAISALLPVVRHFVLEGPSTWFDALLLGISIYLFLHALDAAIKWIRRYLAPRQSPAITASGELSVDPMVNLGRQEPRVYSVRTAKELREEVEGKTELVAKDISRRHMGNWIDFSGSIKQVTGSNSSILVECVSSTGDRWLCRFDSEEWRDRLARFDQGDEISGCGKIWSIFSTSIGLEDCSLDEVMPAGIS